MNSMIDSNNDFVSRRRWLGVASMATLGAGLLASSTAAKSDENSTPLLGARVYNIRDFGAKGDGKTLDTAAVQATIDACAKDQGGTVLVPAGVFLIGTIEIKSNVTLHLAAQGKLLGSADGKQYRAADVIPLEGDSTLGDGNVALIFAVNAGNITIEGMGTIDGQGTQFRSPTRGATPPAGVTGHRRPYHLLFYRCKNLTVRDILLKDSAYHSLRVVQSSFVKLEGLHIHSRVTKNNDGFHFISAQYVHVSNCDVQCQDDACALFGSCQFVTITNSSFSTRWSVFRFGGGIAENITVSNCLIHEAYGCPVKMRCSPGARFENISFSNLVMNKVTGPISLGLGTEHPGSAEEAKLPPGILRNISFSGIRATVVVPSQIADVEFPIGFNIGEIKSCIVLNGVNENIIENINFDNIHIAFAGGGTAEEGAVRDVPKVANEYYAIGVPPACALYARNVRGLTLNNIRLETTTPDLRPTVIFDHVTDAAINGLNVQGHKDAESALRFIDTQDVLLTAARLIAPASVFLQVEGDTSGGITIDGGDLSKAAAPLAFKAGALQKSVNLRA